MNKHPLYIVEFISIIILLTMQSCNNRYEKKEIADIKTKSPIINQSKYSIIKYVTFYIENSGSMKGYVNGETEFVNVVNDLAQYPNLVKANTKFSYNLISGKEHPNLNKGEVQLTTTELGSNVSVLKSRLTRMHTKSSGNSDLNSMFKLALQAAVKDSISILISDGIYDVGGSDNPMNSIENEGSSTRTAFLHKLSNDNLETIIIKLESKFTGYYYPANVANPKGKRKWIPSKKRPYYIWIFGSSNLLKKYFPEERLKKLKGYVDVARFHKLDQNQVQYGALGYNNFGFRINNEDLYGFKLDQNYTNSNKFNVAVDFSKLDLSDSYLTSTINYSCSGNYTVAKINKIDNDPSNDLKPYLNILKFKPTHIITVASSSHPQTGEMKISLNKKLPKWIEDTNANNDYPFDGNENQTFGFKALIGGIEGAYNEVSETPYYSQFKITIKK